MNVLQTVNVKGPYNFNGILDRLSIDPLNEVNLAERTVKVPLIMEGEPRVAVVKGIGTTESPKFIIEGSNDDKTIKRLAHILQWDVPLTDIHQHFLTTDLKEIFEQHMGTPLVLDFDPYRTLIKCIIHQQLNMSFAHTLTERFVKQFGFEKNGVFFYPPPETVANITEEELRELQFSGRKAQYIIGIAKVIAEGQLDLDALAEKSDDEVMASLIKLRGVGPWTVQNFLMFGLGRKNLFPMADIGIQNAIKKLYNLERKPTIEEMEQYKKAWEPYLSYASLYLWRSIE